MNEHEKIISLIYTLSGPCVLQSEKTSQNHVRLMEGRQFHMKFLDGACRVSRRPGSSSHAWKFFQNQYRTGKVRYASLQSRYSAFIVLQQNFAFECRSCHIDRVRNMCRGSSSHNSIQALLVLSETYNLLQTVKLPTTEYAMFPFFLGTMEQPGTRCFMEKITVNLTNNLGCAHTQSPNTNNSISAFFMPICILRDNYLTLIGASTTFSGQQAIPNCVQTWACANKRNFSL